MTVCADGLPGGRAAVAGDISSQFLSGLLMAAPYALSPVELLVEGKLVSQPYVDMTLAVMKAFGVGVQADASCRFQIAAPQCYRGRSYAIEPDASAASYFFAAAAIAGGSVTVEGLVPPEPPGRRGLLRLPASRWAAASITPPTRSPSPAARCTASRPT